MVYRSVPLPPVAAGSVSGVMAVYCVQLWSAIVPEPKLGAVSAAVVMVKESVSLSGFVSSLSVTV